jgi:hypothetical protein
VSFSHRPSVTKVARVLPSNVVPPHLIFDVRQESADCPLRFEDQGFCLFQLGVEILG